ncbi:leucine-rich repeat domain-containing protein [Pseudomonas sp. Je.1.5.c]|uniref:dermonecrotic toxin domain-containing protein n=1 Tax=Pseudomonas sp. Je.1.5.c TaxID=3142839 RepID=UPI003DA8F680
MTAALFRQDSVDALIASRLPAWLTDSSAEHIGRLRSSLNQQQRSQHQLAALFAKITPLDTFAERALANGLQAQFQLSIDVRQAKLRRTSSAIIASVAPGGLGRTVQETREISLLAAALHNFAASETAPSGGLETAVLVDADDEALPLSVQSFMALCGSLDIGAQYQQHLRSVLPATGAAGKKIEALLEEGARASLDAAVRLAALRGDIDQRSYFQFLPVMAKAPVVAADASRLLPFDLRVLGKRVRGAVAFEVRRGGLATAPLEGVVAWIPDDPQGALSRYRTWDELFSDLGRRLQSPGYRAFFQRFISERDRVAFSSALAPLLSANTAAAIELDGRYFSIGTPLFAHLRKVRIDTLLDDAQVLATPSAEVDSAQRDRRLSDYASAGLDVLGLASLFIPALGLPLLGITALQIAEHVYEGYADWRLGDRQGALNHVLGVAENLALGTAVAAVGVAAGRLIERSAYVDGLIPIQTATGALKLISADLPGYALGDLGLQVGERSAVAGQLRLRTPSATYQVLERAPGAELRIQHPTNPHAYMPLLEDNGEGGWRHELETPQEWQGAALLLRRLGSRWAELDEQSAERIMHITGFDEDRLRRLHLDHAPAPARLHDALQAYQLREQQPGLIGVAFAQQFSALQVPSTPAQQLLRQHFSSLSARAAQQIVSQASAEMVEQMLASQRVPLALASEARWLIRDYRLDRACAGFYQASAINADGQRLALGLIADWAPWSSAVRIELRDLTSTGALLAEAGPAMAAQVRLIVKTAEGYQALAATGALLTTAAPSDSLFTALWLHLDEAQKQLMGGAGRSAQQLAEALAVRASARREQVAQLLGMAPIEGNVRAPVRLGDGRLGYPLSGGQPDRRLTGSVLTTEDQTARRSIHAGLRQLFPHWHAADVTWMAHQLAQRPARTVWTAFSELSSQVRGLRSSLWRWYVQATGATYTSRQRVGRLLAQAWQPHDFGPGGISSLRIEGERVGTLPTLPANVHFAHIRNLSLSNIGLSTLEQAFLARFSNLTSLLLGGNSLTTVPDLASFTRLTRLDLQRNQLSQVRGLGQLTQLTQLRLNDNQLSELPGLENLRRLSRLDLQDNRLTGVPGLENLVLLIQLDLSGNRLTALSGQLERLTGVQFLNMGRNQLTAVPQGIERMVGLNQLNLASNQLTELPDSLGQLAGLLHLHLGGNRLSVVPVALGNLTQLRILNLASNQLTEIPLGLERLRQMTELYLGNNQIVIDLAGGQRLEAFSRLQMLSLNRNPIGMIAPLRNLDHLRHLALRETGLTEFPLAFLQAHPQLHVDIAGNLIVELSEQALQWVHQHPHRVNLANNPLDEEAMARWRAAQMRIDTLRRQGRSVSWEQERL